NFLFDEKNEKAAVIDFGFAQNTHLFRQLRDFYIFLNMRREKPSFLTQAGRDTLWYFVDFYCTELKDYILANRFKAAQTAFCYAVVIIAAISGASMLGVASILAQELIRATLLPSLSKLLEALQDHYELRAFNQKQKAAMRCFYYGVIGVMITLQGLLLALQVMNVQNCFSSLFSQLSNFGDACIHSQQF
ncbi:MAG TPA: hypothetical protein PLD88_15340, partial [Candidatus Berkiella sp.]|nr:hypothetical protein [Candidatus Berkiella sp.]